MRTALTILLSLLLAACGGKDDPPVDSQERAPEQGYLDCYPGTLERCNNHDDDCDARVDEGAVDRWAWFSDSDGDSFGNPGVYVVGCDKPGETWVPNGDDCDDDQPDVHPDADERCGNLRDDDCDGLVDSDDDSVVDLQAWWDDDDNDTWGGGLPLFLCGPQPERVSLGGDCDDTADYIYPFAPEDLDGLDNDCDGVVDEGDP